MHHHKRLFPGIVSVPAGSDSWDTVLNLLPGFHAVSHCESRRGPSISTEAHGNKGAVVAGITVVDKEVERPLCRASYAQCGEAGHSMSY